jgi:uncharacterized membrane protein
MVPALMAHIAGGGIGLVTGSVALTVAKGERLHRAFGTVFVAAMLVMAGMGSYLAVTVPGQISNLSGGLFTLYLVTTAWMTVRRKEGTIGRFEIGALAVSGVSAIIGTVLAVLVANPSVKLHTGAPKIAVYILAVVMLIAAATDLKVVLQHGVSGSARIARHLWRMCLGLFVASGSFFLGKQADMPAFVRGSPILIALAVAPLVLLVFWLFRVWLTSMFRGNTIPQTAS